MDLLAVWEGVMQSGRGMGSGRGDLEIMSLHGIVSRIYVIICAMLFVIDNSICLIIYVLLIFQVFYPWNTHVS